MIILYKRSYDGKIDAKMFCTELIINTNTLLNMLYIYDASIFDKVKIIFQDDQCK